MGVTLQMAQMGQGMQQLEMTVAMHKQQHQEDFVKIMAAQAMTLSNLSLGQQQQQHQQPVTLPVASKKGARPGPRERQRMRQAAMDEALVRESADEFDGQSCVGTGHDSSSNSSVAGQNAKGDERSCSWNAERLAKTDIPLQTTAQNSRTCAPSQFFERDRSRRIEEDELLRVEEDIKRSRSSISSGATQDASLPSLGHFFWMVTFLIMLPLSITWVSSGTAGAVKDLGNASPLHVNHFTSMMSLAPSPVLLLDNDEDVVNASVLLADRTEQSVPSKQQLSEGGVESKRQTAERMRELGHLRLAVSDCAGAAVWFRKALTLLDEADRSLLLRGSAAPSPGQTRAGNTTAALVVVDSAKPTWHDRQAVLGDHGFALVCAQRYAAGLDALQEALRLRGQNRDGPASPHLSNAQGVAYFQAGQYDRAKEVFASIAAKFPQNPILWNNLGAASVLSGEFEAAEKAMYQALDATSELQHSSVAYYRQLVSNNVHILRHRSSRRAKDVGVVDAEGDLLAAASQPVVELFNCVAADVASIAAASNTKDFAQRFERLRDTRDDSGPRGSESENLVSPDVLAGAQSSVLSAEREPLFCP